MLDDKTTQAINDMPGELRKAHDAWVQARANLDRATRQLDNRGRELKNAIQVHREAIEAERDARHVYVKHIDPDIVIPGAPR